MTKHLLLVTIGGGAGACLRYLTGLWALRLLGPQFPWGTLMVNVLGSFTMGIMAELIMRKLGDYQDLRLLLMTGLLGGYTTFSAFSLDAVQLFEKGEVGTGAIYVIASVLGSILALFVGLLAARFMI